MLENRASVAQQVEHPAVNRTVGSSSLSRGATNLPQGYEEEIFKTLWNIRNLSKNTQIIYAKNLKRISRNSDLNNPTSVEKYVFGIQVTNKYRNSLFDAYSQYCKANEIEWLRPVLKTEVYPVKIPTEENIDKIIACATQRYATIFQISKHGLRPDEISKITLRDIDLERSILLVKTSKMGLERSIRLNRLTKDLLQEYVALETISDIHRRLFASPRTIRDTWCFY